MPTNRPVASLSDGLDLASRAAISLIVACSKRVGRYQVIRAAAERNVERKVRAAQISIGKSRLQLDRIKPDLCQKFIDLGQADLAEWRRYLTTLPNYESVEEIRDHFRLDYSVSSPSTR